MLPRTKIEKLPRKGSEQFEDYMEKYGKLFLEIASGHQAVLYDGMVIQNKGPTCISICILRPKSGDK